MMRRLAVVLAVSSLTACGTTVAQVGSAGLEGQGAAGAGNGLGAAAPGTANVDGSLAGSAQQGARPAAAGAGGTVPAGGSSVGAGSAPGSAVGPGAAVTAIGGSGAPGVTATTISVGLPYGTNGRAAAAAFGATGAGAGGGNGQQIWSVALKLINDNGGVLGRKLVPVWHAVDSTSPDTQASIQQAMCADFTEDHKVFWASYTAAATLTPCLAKAGVSQTASQPTDAATSLYRRYPNYIEAGTLQMDRVASGMPGLLRQQGWFGAWDTARGVPGGVAPVKIGIVAFDDNYTKNAVNNILVPALKRIVPGSPIVIEVQTPQSAADNGSAIAAMQNATLRFRQEGVTHVIPFETQGAGIGVFVSQGADKQSYYPRYGVNSGNAVQLYVDQGLWPTSQLNGMLGIGWAPLLDLSNSANPDSGPYSNASRRRCLALMQKNGVDVSSAIIKRQALEYCTNLSFLKAALEAGGSTVSAQSFRRGAERLGSSFQSGLTFATRFDAAHHDGVSQVRALAYTSSCGCMKYGANLLPIG
jgi:hypothetical protein